MSQLKDRVVKLSSFLNLTRDPCCGYGNYLSEINDFANSL